MNPDTIDQHILLIADALTQKVSQSHIIQTYIDSNFTMSDISLLLAAATIIYNDRINGTPPEYAFNERKLLKIKRI